LTWAILKFAASFGKNLKKKIRTLFADAQHDQETLGDGGKLHIIIFDELICKRRTRCNEYTRVDVQDNVTTQLLTELMGLHHLITF
jgi:hypothetical protein